AACFTAISCFSILSPACAFISAHRPVVLINTTHIHKAIYRLCRVVSYRTTMSDISSGLVESLKTLGLTEYEAKVYSALVLFDRAEVKQIYEYLDAPKPSVYQSLRSLTEKGLVQVVSAKPAIYRATPTKIAIKHMIEVHQKAEETALQELEKLEKSRVESDYPDVLWTLYGDENVEHKLEELLGKAQKSVKAILPREFLKYLEIL